jgi:hypothetical protein
MMKNSLNSKLQDAYISREVLLRRVAAGVFLKLDKRIIELGHELAALAKRIDPISPSTELEKMRRRKQLDKEGSALIAKRMAEMKVELNAALKAIGAYEASFASKLLEEALNGLI